jgi:hypothetical protein
MGSITRDTLRVGERRFTQRSYWWPFDCRLCEDSRKVQMIRDVLSYGRRLRGSVMTMDRRRRPGRHQVKLSDRRPSV